MRLRSSADSTSKIWATCSADALLSGTQAVNSCLSSPGSCPCAVWPASGSSPHAVTRQTGKMSLLQWRDCLHDARSTTLPALAVRQLVRTAPCGCTSGRAAQGWGDDAGTVVTEVQGNCFKPSMRCVGATLPTFSFADQRWSAKIKTSLAMF